MLSCLHKEEHIVVFLSFSKEKNSISVCVKEKDEINAAQNRERQKLLFGWWTIAERQKGVMVISHQKYLWVT